jgi:hypothetical protein
LNAAETLIIQSKAQRPRTIIYGNVEIDVLLTTKIRQRASQFMTLFAFSAKIIIQFLFFPVVVFMLFTTCILGLLAGLLPLTQKLL